MVILIIKENCFLGYFNVGRDDIENVDDLKTNGSPCALPRLLSPECCFGHYVHHQFLSESLVMSSLVNVIIGYIHYQLLT